MKFVLIGQSPAVIAAVKAICGKDPTAQVVIISCDGHLPYNRFFMPRLILKKMKEKELFLETEEFFKTNNVAVILDKEITRINFNRRRVFLSEKQSVDYDVLIMADAPQVRLPNLKGVRRTGFFHLARLDSVKGIVRHLPFIETVVIEPSSVRGIETALALKELGKDVLVSVEQDRLLAGSLDEATSTGIAALLEKRGVRVISNNSFEDILGEVEVKAVRFKNGKVVACEAVIMEDLPPDLRFLEEGELVMGARVPVTGAMATNVKNVYAVDALCQLESPKLIGSYSLSREDSERQGEVAALAALGDPVVYDRLVADGFDLLKRVFSAEELSEDIPVSQIVEAGSVLSEAAASSGSGTDPAGTSGG